jgi:Fe-S cluster assembly protein SufD
MKLSTLKDISIQELTTLLKVEGREQLLEKFYSLGLPNKESEAYRYFDVEKLLESDYTISPALPGAIGIGKKVVIIDGVVSTAPKGLRIYYKECESADMEHFDPMYFLSHLLSPVIIKIEVDGDAELEIEHHFTKSNSLVPYRIVLHNQANRHATIYESFIADDIENTLVLYGYDMHVAQDSTLRVVKMHSMIDSRYAMIASHKVNVAKQANALIKSFDLGGGQALQLMKIELDTYAHVDAAHLLYLNKDSKRGTVSQMIHKGEHSTSKQEAKNILDGKARGIFDALIKVERSAKYTKAEQNSKSILLHKEAYMAAKPQLEIYIDELEASHGATTGQLSEKQLFYLQSRGISYTEARKILVIAFANTLIETVKDTRQQEQIKAAFEEVFYTTHQRG